MKTLLFRAGKTVVQIAAVQAPVNDLLKIGTVEPVLTFKLLVIDPDKDFKMVLHAPVIKIIAWYP